MATQGASASVSGPGRGGAEVTVGIAIGAVWGTVTPILRAKNGLSSAKIGPSAPEGTESAATISRLTVATTACRAGKGVGEVAAESRESRA